MRGNSWIIPGVIFVLLLVGTDFASGLSNREVRIVSGEDASEARDGDRVEVEGRVRLVGSEPFSDLVITDDFGNDWYVAEDRGVLGSLEQQRVIVQADIRRRRMTLANGRELGQRLELYDIVVIESQR